MSDEFQVLKSAYDLKCLEVKRLEGLVILYGIRPELPSAKIVFAENEDLRAKLQAAEAERDGANRRADLFREKLTDCESALHRAEAELQGIASVSTTDWDDPSDFKAWAQSRARHALLNNRMDHHAGLANGGVE